MTNKQLIRGIILALLFIGIIISTTALGEEVNNFDDEYKHLCPPNYTCLMLDTPIAGSELPRRTIGLTVIKPLTIEDETCTSKSWWEREYHHCPAKPKLYRSFIWHGPGHEDSENLAETAANDQTNNNEEDSNDTVTEQPEDNTPPEREERDEPPTRNEYPCD